QASRLGPLIDEKAKARASRERFEPNRAGAREEVEHARAGDRIAMAMRENIEDRLAQAVGCRPDRPARRGGDDAAAKAAGEDPHRGGSVAKSASAGRLARRPVGARRPRLEVPRTRATRPGAARLKTMLALAARLEASRALASRLETFH